MEKGIMREVDKLISSIDELLIRSEGKVVSIFDPVELCVANVISSLLMGHTLEKEMKFKKLKNLFQSVNTLTSSLQGLLLGLYPWLRFIPLFEHFGYDMVCRFREMFFDLIAREMAEHKTDFDPDAEPADYTSAFLKEMYTRRRETGQNSESFTSSQLWAALFDMWAAGMETTFTILKWAFLYLVHFPEVQEKCFNEISQILNHREAKIVKIADKNHAPFLVATLAEIQRCVNLLPLNLQHKLTKDVVVNGFSLPKGVVVLPQISAVLSDEKYFSSPEKFDPWRFLLEDGKTLNNLEHVIPFSIGKRACLGENLARMELFLIFATLIQKYKFSVPESDQMPTLESKPGFIRVPHPYEILLEKRNAM